MSNTIYFFRGRKSARKNVKVRAGSQFVFPDDYPIESERGKVVPWEVKTISAEKNREIKSESREYGKEYGEASGLQRYYELLVIACTVDPNLKSVELQGDDAGVGDENAYGVIGEDELLNQLLLPGEIESFGIWLRRFNGFDEDFSDKVVAAKN